MLYGSQFAKLPFRKLISTVYQIEYGNCFNVGTYGNPGNYGSIIIPGSALTDTVGFEWLSFNELPIGVSILTISGGAMH